MKLAPDLQPVPFFSVLLAKLMASNQSSQSKTDQKGNCYKHYHDQVLLLVVDIQQRPRDQRTDDVEEAEGEIDKCRDTKNRTLRHTAGCPWNQYARYGSAILCTSAQEFRTIA